MPHRHGIGNADTDDEEACLSCNYLSIAQKLDAPLPGEETDIDSLLCALDPPPKVTHPEPVHRTPTPCESPLRVRRGSRKNALPPIKRGDSVASKSDTTSGSQESISTVSATQIRPIQVAPAPGSPDSSTDTNRMSVTNGAYDREDGNNVELRLRRNRGLEGGDDSLKEAQYSPPSSWPVGMDDLSNLRRWDSAEEIAVSVHQVSGVVLKPSLKLNFVWLLVGNLISLAMDLKLDHPSCYSAARSSHSVINYTWNKVQKQYIFHL